MKRFFLCGMLDNEEQYDVAECVEFSDGTVVLRWLGDTPSTAVHGDVASFSAIHIRHHRGRFIRHVDFDPPVRTEDHSQRWWAAYNRGWMVAYQDRCENVPFATIGGKDRRSDMQAPSYIEEEDREAYLEGYRGKVREMFGEDWETCLFEWKHVMTIGWMYGFGERVAVVGGDIEEPNGEVIDMRHHQIPGNHPDGVKEEQVNVRLDDGGETGFIPITLVRTLKDQASPWKKGHRAVGEIDGHDMRGTVTDAMRQDDGVVLLTIDLDDGTKAIRVPTWKCCRVHDDDAAIGGES